MTASVTLERDGAVAIATLANPPRHTMTAQTVAELAAAAAAVDADPDVRVLLLSGAGDGVFVAHYEVAELAAAAERNVARAEAAQSGAAKPVDPMPAGSADSVGPSGDAIASRRSRPASPRPAELHPLHRVLLRLESLRAITIAAMNGNAAGGGCELALACDFRLMADGAFHIGLPETSVGIIPGAGGTQRMARLLGTARALDLVLHGTLLAPAEALAIGLVHRVLPQAGFRAAAPDFAVRLAGRAPLALAAAKQAIRRGVGLPLEEALALEQRCFERTMNSRDAAGAMRALLDGSDAFLRGDPYPWKGE